MKNKVLNQAVLLDQILASHRKDRLDKDSTVTDKMVSHYAAKLNAENLSVPQDVLDALYDRLIEDGLINRKVNLWEYEITGKGILFNENDGYRKRANDINLEKSTRMLERTVLALGALGALGYFLLEIWKYYLSTCNCH